MYFLCKFSVIFTIAIALLMTWKNDEKTCAVETFFKTGSYIQTMLSMFSKRLTKQELHIGLKNSVLKEP